MLAEGNLVSTSAAMAAAAAPEQDTAAAQAARALIADCHAKLATHTPRTRKLRAGVQRCPHRTQRAVVARRAQKPRRSIHQTGGASSCCQVSHSPYE